MRDLATTLESLAILADDDIITRKLIEEAGLGDEGEEVCIEDRILAAVAERGTARESEIAKGCQVARSAIRRPLARLVQDGKLVKVEGGYRVAGPGAAMEDSAPEPAGQEEVNAGATDERDPSADPWTPALVGG